MMQYEEIDDDTLLVLLDEDDNNDDKQVITIKEIKRVFQEYKFLRILLIIITAFVFVSLLYHFVFGRVPKYKTVDGFSKR